MEWPDAGSSLMASLDELGLKLEAKKEPVEVLVIDRAERPSANWSRDPPANQQAKGQPADDRLPFPAYL